MDKPDRPIDTSLAVAVSGVAHILTHALEIAGFRCRKQRNQLIWWITSSTGLTTRLSYHAAIGWVVISESPHCGPALYEVVQSMWRTHNDRVTD